MGIAESRFDQLPVIGHSTELGILPAPTQYGVNGAYCIRPEATVLKNERQFSWSGEDCIIKV